MCFKGTASRIGGATFDMLGRDVLALHDAAYAGKEFPEDSAEAHAVPNPGDYAFRSQPGSEKHMNDPVAIALLQEAAQVGGGGWLAGFRVGGGGGKGGSPAPLCPCDCSVLRGPGWSQGESTLHLAKPFRRCSVECVVLDMCDGVAHGGGFWLSSGDTCWSLHPRSGGDVEANQCHHWAACVPGLRLLHAEPGDPCYVL